MRTLVTVAALGLFVGMLWYGAQQEAQVQCDACFTFKGRTECRVGVGATEESAIASANSASCAMLGSGVTDAMRCGALAPSLLRCREH
ncbi:MAG: hypothetical protein VX614_10280 [Myxococcota bacterium]|nr:hypothetical protein [Myxococcota bacterium]